GRLALAGEGAGRHRGLPLDQAGTRGAGVVGVAPHVRGVDALDGAGEGAGAVVGPVGAGLSVTAAVAAVVLVAGHEDLVVGGAHVVGVAVAVLEPHEGTVGPL